MPEPEFRLTTRKPEFRPEFRRQNAGTGIPAHVKKGRNSGLPEFRPIPSSCPENVEFEGGIFADL